MEQITSYSSSISDGRPILVVDGLNNFIRFYLVNETMNANGDMFGGALGMIRFLKHLTRTFRPSKLVVVWEQGGASARRKKLFPEYKANRAKQKDFNGLYKSDRDALMDDSENKARQLLFLTRALSALPIMQIYIPDCEGDDVVAYLIKRKFSQEPGIKVVVSSDKDFYQLLEDENVRVFHPAKKTLLCGKDVLDDPEFGIAPRNFTIARAIIGDTSDNIPGVDGLGFKTVAKRFSFLSDNTQDYDLDQLFQQAKLLKEGAKKPPKCYEDLLMNEGIVRRNYELMFLDTNCFSASQIEKINYRVDDFKPAVNHLDFLKAFSAFDLPITQDLYSIPQDFRFMTTNSL